MFQNKPTSTISTNENRAALQQNKGEIHLLLDRLTEVVAQIEGRVDRFEQKIGPVLRPENPPSPTPATDFNGGLSPLSGSIAMVIDVVILIEQRLADLAARVEL